MLSVLTYCDGDHFCVDWIITCVCGNVYGFFFGFFERPLGGRLRLQHCDFEAAHDFILFADRLSEKMAAPTRGAVELLKGELPLSFTRALNRIQAFSLPLLSPS